MEAACCPIMHHLCDDGEKPQLIMQKKEPIILDSACVRDDELIGAMDAIAILSGKWKIQLITALNCGGPLQFMELLRLLDGIGPKMLSRELQDLEMNRIVSREALETKPATVRYALTQHGRSLERIINELRCWGGGHRRLILGR
jgi:DNA-binding HxlR family transcriptional regulator